MGRHPTSTRRVAGSWAVVLTLADQIVSSASNFAVGVLIARVSGAEGLGGFGVAFVVWLAVVGVNRAMVTEPMTVDGAAGSGDGALLRRGLLASVALGIGVAALLAGVGGSLQAAGVEETALLALAPWLPSLLAQDYWRAMAFRAQRADHALVNDVVFVAVQAAFCVGVVLLGAASVTAFIAAWGVGATAGALVGHRLSRVGVSWRGGLTQLRLQWVRARWFLAEFGTTFVGSQGYLLLLPVLVGKADFGIFRAGFSLVGPVVIVFLAGGNIALPEYVRRLHSGGASSLAAYTPRLTAMVVGAATLYCGAVALLAGFLVDIAYGPGFEGAGLIAQLVAAQYVVFATVFGVGLAMKALNEVKKLWMLRAVNAVVSVAGLIVLTTAYGLVGAAASGIVSAVVFAVGSAFVYRRVLRRCPNCRDRASQHCCGRNGQPVVTER